MPKPKSNPTRTVLKPILVNRENLASLTGLSDGTIEAMIRRGEFPKPRQTSARRVGWLLRELEEWAEARPVSDLPPPPNTGGRAGRALAEMSLTDEAVPAGSTDLSLAGQASSLQAGKGKA